MTTNDWGTSGIDNQFARLNPIPHPPHPAGSSVEALIQTYEDRISALQSQLAFSRDETVRATTMLDRIAQICAERRGVGAEVNPYPSPHHPVQGRS